MNIAIIGSGNVGSALAQGLYKAGHTIFFGVRDAASAKAEKASGLVSNAKIVSVAEASKQGEVIIITTRTSVWPLNEGVDSPRSRA